MVALATSPAITRESKSDNSSIRSDWLLPLEGFEPEEKRWEREILANIITGLVVARMKSDPVTSTIAELISLAMGYEPVASSFSDFITMDMAYQYTGDVLRDEVIPRMPLKVQELRATYALEGRGRPRRGTSEIEIDT